MLLLAACSGGSSDSGSSSSTQTSIVAGVDSNNNGVRDDVERYIIETYPDPAQTETRAALMQYAEVLQSIVVDVSNPSTATATVAGVHLQAVVIAYQCLGARRPDDFSSIQKDLLNLILDTEARQQAYFQAAQLAERGPNPVFLDPASWASSCS